MQNWRLFVAISLLHDPAIWQFWGTGDVPKALLKLYLPEFRFRMPLGVKPCCATCKTTDSPMWRKHRKGYIQCNSCGLKDLPPTNDNNGNNTATATTGAGGRSNGGRGREATRKSSRNVKKLRYKQMVVAAPKQPSTKGKSRRIIFKRNVSFTF